MKSAPGFSKYSHEVKMKKEYVMYGTISGFIIVSSNNHEVAKCWSEYMATKICRLLNKSKKLSVKTCPKCGQKIQ